MRYCCAFLLAALLAVPAAAAQTTATVAIPVNLTFSGSEITGTFGGVPVGGTSTGTDAGTFMLTVDGEVFATGTYVCTSAGCTFMGTELLDTTTEFTFTSPTLTNPAKGSFAGVFRNHGAWVSAVAKWSKANLRTMRVSQVVRAAASIKAKNQLSTDTSMSRERNGRGKGR